MTLNRRSLGIGFVLCLTLAAPAGAQNDQAPLGERGTELGALLGAGSTSTHTGPMMAGVAGWRLKSWLIGEARGAWLARGRGADGFEADLGLAVNLTRRGPGAPYVAAGFGLYRATFESAESAMSDFYRRRLGQSAIGTTPGRSFTDPVFRLSAGVDIPLRTRFVLRPEASALFVRRGGRGETIGLFGLRVGYRFEDHPVTP